MKKFVVLASMALLSVGLYAKDMKTLVVTPTPKMTCQNCEKKIKLNIRFVKGTSRIDTDLKTQEVTITYDADKAKLEDYQKAFSKIGYEIKEVEKTAEKPAEKK